MKITYANIDLEFNQTGSLSVTIEGPVEELAAIWRKLEGFATSGEIVYAIDNDDLKRRVLDIAKSSDKIQLIKAYRTIMHADLVTSKNWVEENFPY